MIKHRMGTLKREERKAICKYIKNYLYELFIVFIGAGLMNIIIALIFNR